ncbi:uncharacterized protein CBL_20475 [Carabus blaptoides fortunei]
MSTDESSLVNNNQIEWIEEQAIPELGFRIWHVMFLCLSVLLIIVILICCCVKIRIPRTKQEIEADYQRKKIARKFRERLRLIQNQDMDNMDLKLALERVQTDFDNETRKLIDFDATHSNLFAVEEGNMKAEPQQPVDLNNATRKLAMLMSLTRSKQATDSMNQVDTYVKC